MTKNYACLFDSYCKRVLKNAANDYYEELCRRQRREIPLDELWDTPSYTPHYCHVYNVFGVAIRIHDADLISALDALPADTRTIILASYCVGLSDKAVAERLHLVRRTVAYRRLRALEVLRRALLDAQDFAN